MEHLGGGLPAHGPRAALRLRAERLTVRALFLGLLLMVAIGLAFFIVVGLIHN
jgi:hypothetical protein